MIKTRFRPVFRTYFNRTYLTRIRHLLAVILSFVILCPATLFWSEPARAAEKSKNSFSVLVEKAPIVVSRHFFDLNNPPPDLPPLRPGELGTTLATYGRVFRFKIDVVSTSRKGGQYEVVVSPVSATIKLSLPVHIWVPRGAPAKLIRHEEGHRLIHESIYKDAGELIRFHAANLADARYRGVGKSYKAALKNAYRLIGEDLNDIYQRYVYEYSKSVGEEYDRITSHGANRVSEGAALTEAFEQHGAYRAEFEDALDYLKRSGE